jgi:hypothetical protein
MGLSNETTFRGSHQMHRIKRIITITAVTAVTVVPALAVPGTAAARPNEAMCTVMGAIVNSLGSLGPGLDPSTGRYVQARQQAIFDQMMAMGC